MNLNCGDSSGALEKLPALCKVIYSLKRTSMDPWIPFHSPGSFVGRAGLWGTAEEIKAQGCNRVVPGYAEWVAGTGLS